MWIDQIWGPVHDFLCKSPKSMLILGIQGPQGCGKSTFCEALQMQAQAFSNEIVTFYVTLSLDDFYYTLTEQKSLNLDQSNGNPFLRGRGNPGTHDVPLLSSTLDQVKQVYLFDDSKREILVPRRERMKLVILLEGWFVGFSAKFVDPHSSIDANCKEIQANLKVYQGIWSELDFLITISVSDDARIFTWRQEAEDAMRNEHGDTMGLLPFQVKELVERCLPVYRMFERIKKPGLAIELDANRQIVSCKNTG